jgi:hypothetical protein
VTDLLFAGITVAIYAAALPIAGMLPSVDYPELVAAAVALDIVAVVPLAFYLLILRRRRLPIVTILPVLVLSAVAAAWILPRDHRQPLRLLEILVIPLELGLIGWIAWRATRAVGIARRDAAADPVERLRRAAFELVQHEGAAAILSTELAVLYYSLLAWRARSHEVEGEIACTHHRRSGHVGIVVAFLLVLLVEGVAVHLIVSIWSAGAAWALSIGTAYAGMWLVADYRATALRPILVGKESVWVRAGLRWSVQVPRSLIEAVERRRPDSGKECLDTTFLGSPTRWLILNRTVRAQGPYGLSRQVRAVGIQPDDPGEFDRSLDNGADREMKDEPPLALF